MTEKVALLFLTMGDHAQPEIWENFLCGYKQKFNIYCHPYLPSSADPDKPDGKNLIPKTSFLYDGIVSTRVPTKWGHLTNAYYQLLAKAMEDPDNRHFVFLSDTCVPLKSANEVFSELKQCSDRTLMNAPRPWEDQKRYKNRLEIDRKLFFKHSGWFALCRTDAWKLLKAEKWFSALNTIHAGDEHILSILKQSGSSSLEHRPVTYVHWDLQRHDLYRSGKLHQAYRSECNPLKKQKLEQDLARYRHASRHPVAWKTRVTEQDVQRFDQSGCLFARKFMPGCDVQMLIDRVNADQSLFSPSLTRAGSAVSLR